jgi:hypothetical protein
MQSKLPERFLARSIPNLELDLFSIDGYHPSTELDTNGQVVHWLETLVRELEQQARLPDAGVADDDVFEQVRVRHTEGLFFTPRNGNKTTRKFHRELEKVTY